MVKHWDLVKYKIVDFGLAAKEKMLELGLVIQQKVVGAVIKFYETLGKLPGGIGKTYREIADFYRGFIDNTKEGIQAIQTERAANKSAYEQAEIERQKSIESNNTEAKAIEDANARKTKSYFEYAENMKAALELITMTEQAKRNQDVADATAFFEQRAELESEDFGKRFEFLNAQAEAIKTMDGITAEQRVNMLAAVTKATEKENRKQMQARAQYGQQLLSTTGQTLSDLQQVFQNFGKQSRELAIAAKAIAIAQAIINTYLGFTSALTIFPPPLAWAMAAVTLASGLAAVARIVTTPIPSGQTGLNYTVPDIPQNRNDRAAVNASAGEQVQITPRGESSEKTTVVKIDIGKDNLV
jgi:hypothetical protein